MRVHLFRICHILSALLLLLQPTVASSPWPLHDFDGDAALPHSPIESVRPRASPDCAGHPQHRETLLDLRQALDVLQNTWFKLYVGTWPTSIDWTGAVLNTHLVATLSTFSKALNLTHPAGHDCAPDLLAQSDSLLDDINIYFSQSAAYFFGENAFAIRHQAYDDMLWVVLSWLETIKFTNLYCSSHYDSQSDCASRWHGKQFDSIFARRARTFYNLTTHGWSTDLCGGGMTWNPALEPYKNAITNELYIAASVGMYLHFPGDTHHSYSLTSSQDPLRAHFLTAAVDGYDWLKSSNMTNHQGLYVDGYHIGGWRRNGTGGTACNRRNEMLYTYNQGVILSGLRGLWEATGNATYLNDGYKLISNTMLASGWSPDRHQPTNTSEWRGMGRAGILEDICDSNGRCNQDGHSFKGIYFHHLSLFCQALPSEPLMAGKTFAADPVLATLHRRNCHHYGLWVAHNADAAATTRDDDGRFGTWWGAKYYAVNAQAAPLPRNAVDYRNDPSELLSPPFADLYTPSKSRTKSVAHRPVQQPLHRKRDHNDRGRGRTVESHSGGVAVLRALWEFQNLK